jgi:hypothetical protein
MEPHAQRVRDSLVAVILPLALGRDARTTATGTVVGADFQGGGGMDGYSFAKDGERSSTARSIDPCSGTRAAVSMDDTNPLAGSNAWIRDHEAIYTWLRGIPESERPGFLGRIASNIESLHDSERPPLEPATSDASLSFAILIEYAQHLGVSPVDACWMLRHETAAEVDPLLGARVDRMLADAAQRKTMPRRRGEDADAPIRLNTPRGLSAHWKATARRRARDRREDDTPVTRTAQRFSLRRTESGRAG